MRSIIACDYQAHHCFSGCCWLDKISQYTAFKGSQVPVRPLKESLNLLWSPLKLPGLFILSSLWVCQIATYLSYTISHADTNKSSGAFDTIKPSGTIFSFHPKLAFVLLQKFVLVSTVGSFCNEYHQDLPVTAILPPGLIGYVAQYGLADNPQNIRVLSKRHTSSTKCSGYSMAMLLRLKSTVPKAEFAFISYSDILY